MLDYLVSNASRFLLIFARCFALLLTIPLFSGRTVPGVAKAALGFFMAFIIFPHIDFSSGPFAPYSSFIDPQGRFNLVYILILAGEAMIGIIIGFYISVIFAAFSAAGQFFAFQMGFSASEVYDSLSQVENPLMGQYFNLVAMLVFLTGSSFVNFFFKGLNDSFQTISAISIVENMDSLVMFMVKSLSTLFSNAFVIALPIMATLFVLNAGMGILAKAAPQMNLLAEGFPIMILTTFLILFALFPNLLEFFDKTLLTGFKNLEKLFISLKGGA